MLTMDVILGTAEVGSFTFPADQMDMRIAAIEELAKTNNVLCTVLIWPVEED